VALEAAMKNFLVIPILMVFLFALGCGMVTGKGEAQKVAESFLNERIQNGGTGQDSYYSDLFWKNTDPAKWENIKKLVAKANGNLIGFKLQNWQVKSQTKLNDLSGTFVVLVYETEYQKAKGTETLTMFKRLKDDKFLIMGLNFNSPRDSKVY
jgi:hypothetical protein